MGYTYADLSKEIDAVVEDIWHRIDLFLEMVFAVNKELKFKDLFGVKATTLELLHGIIGDTDTKASILHSLQELTKNEEGAKRWRRRSPSTKSWLSLSACPNKIYRTLNNSQG